MVHFGLKCTGASRPACAVAATVPAWRGVVAGERLRGGGLVIRMAAPAARSCTAAGLGVGRVSRRAVGEALLKRRPTRAGAPLRPRSRGSARSRAAAPSPLATGTHSIGTWYSLKLEDLEDAPHQRERRLVAVNRQPAIEAGQRQLEHQRRPSH